jgi:ubiquinone/menaquinone biosynthesis C-methylase UbiE
MIVFDEAVLIAIDEQRQSASAREKCARYLAMLAPRAGERVLDLGCGSGWLCRTLAPLVAPGGQVIGVDLSPDAVILAARLNGGAAAGGAAFEQADGERLPFADGAFDAAACISVLGFCDAPDRVLAELRRVLRPGGRLVAASSDEDSRLYNGHDRDLGRRIMRAIADRGRDPWAGRRLAFLLQSAGFRLVREEVLAEAERHFSPGTSGYAVAHLMRDHLVARGGIAAEEYDRWLADLRSCEWEGSYCYGVTTYACLAER